jgi:hypothetical protein
MTLGRCINHTPKPIAVFQRPKHTFSSTGTRNLDSSRRAMMVAPPPSATQRARGHNCRRFSHCHAFRDSSSDTSQVRIVTMLLQRSVGDILPQIHHLCCKEVYGRSPDSTFVMPKSKFTVHAVKFVIGRDVRSFHCKREWPFIMLRMTVTFCFRSFLTTTQNPTSESASLP